MTIECSGFCCGSEVHGLVLEPWKWSQGSLIQTGWPDLSLTPPSTLCAQGPNSLRNWSEISAGTSVLVFTRAGRFFYRSELYVRSLLLKYLPFPTMSKTPFFFFLSLTSLRLGSGFLPLLVRAN